MRVLISPVFNFPEAAETPKRRMARISDPVVRFWSKVRIAGQDECWTWTGCLKDGYGMFRIAGMTVKASRYSAELAGMDIEDVLVLHTCDNRLCVNPKHLELGDNDKNMRDAADRNRMKHGEAHHYAKLTVEKVKAIRAARESGRTMQSIADEFECTIGNVHAIVHGKTWRAA